MSHIIIAGGGAAGLELATALGKNLHKHHQITLIEPEAHHYWKPRLHEVATGVFDESIDGISYFTHSHRHHYQHIEAFLRHVDIQNQTIEIENHQQQSQSMDYDYLILTVGAISNDFGTPNAQDHCLFLDSAHQAREAWQQLEHLLKHHKGDKNINIIGGGATGVELAAELMIASQRFHNYNPELLIHVHLIESNARLLAHSTERLSQRAADKLEKLGVHLHLGTKIAEVNADGAVTREQKELPACLQYWTAGIKAPDWLKTLGNFEFNRLNQINVNQDLTTTVSDRIFALGDCACIPQDDNRFVPPKAQAANRAAIHLAKNLTQLIEKQKALTPFIYHDGGMVLSIGHKDAIGEMRDGKLIIKGKIVRDLYDSIFLLHQRNVIGMYRVSRKIMTKKVKKYLHAEEM